MILLLMFIVLSKWRLKTFRLGQLADKMRRAGPLTFEVHHLTCSLNAGEVCHLTCSLNAGEVCHLTCSLNAGEVCTSPIVSIQVKCVT